MAKDLGVDQATVRARMEKFQEQGILKGWSLGINPGNNGQGVCQVWLGVQREMDKADVIRALLSSKEIERVCSYFGPTLSFVLLVDDGVDPKPIVERLLRHAGPAVTLLRKGGIPVPKRNLKDIDTLIIRSLRKNPWKPYLRVAKEVRASTKTVARRVSKMAEEGAIYMLPVVDLKALQGIIPAELVVEYSSPELKEAVNAQVVARIGRNLVFSDITGLYGYFALFIENLSKLEQLGEWCGRQEGVGGMHVSALQDIILNPNYYSN